MSTPLTDAINALTTYANSVTGASDTTLSDAVDTLAAGYGGGGGGSAPATFTATATTTDPTITFEAGDYTIPSKYALFVKSDVTASDGVHPCIIGGFHTKQNVVPIQNVTFTTLGRYYVYKTSGVTDYYNTGNVSQNYLTKNGTTLSLKFNNSHYFKSGGTYSIQIYELDDSFFS